MPYVKQDIRDEWRENLQEVIDQITLGVTLPIGTLNYLITKICLATAPQSYTDFNAIVGVLECVKLEFYRRMVVSYEEYMKQKNGDVYS